MSTTAYTGGELVYLRDKDQSLKLYLAVHKPTTTSNSTLASVPTWPDDGRGVGTITTAGAVTAADGQTIRIKNSAGTYTKGLLRARGATSASTTVNVAATSENALNLATGDLVQIMDDWRVWPKYPRWDGTTLDMDFNDTSFATSNTYFGPIARAGADVAYISNSNFSIPFHATYQSENGVSGLAYLWTFPDGSTSTSANPSWVTADRQNGAWVKLRVTDDATSHTTRRLIWKFSDTNPPYKDFTVNSLRGTWGGGWRGSVTVWSAATISDFPEGARILIFGDATYGTTTVNIGGNTTDRSSSYFSGFIVGGSVQQGPVDGSVTFEIATIDALMETMRGMVMALDYTSGVPASWLDAQDLTINRAAYHWLRWHTTLADVADVHLPTDSCFTALKPSMDLDEASLWEQLNQIYGWVPGGVASVDSQNAIWCEQDKAISGGSLTSIWTAAETDWADVVEVVESETFEQTNSAQVTLYGETFDGTTVTPVGARSPDDPLGYGKDREEVPAGLLMTAAQAKTWAAAKRAKQNNRYPSATFPLFGFWPLDPTPQSKMTATLTTSETPRPPENVTAYIIRDVEYKFTSDKASMGFTTIVTEPLPQTAVDGAAVTFPTQNTLTGNARNSIAQPIGAPRPPGYFASTSCLATTPPFGTIVYSTTLSVTGGINAPGTPYVFGASFGDGIFSFPPVPGDPNTGYYFSNGGNERFCAVFSSVNTQTSGNYWNLCIQNGGSFTSGNPFYKSGTAWTMAGDGLLGGKFTFWTGAIYSQIDFEPGAPSTFASFPVGNYGGNTVSAAMTFQIGAPYSGYQWNYLRTLWYANTGSPSGNVKMTILSMC